MVQSHCRQMYQKVISGQQISSEQERKRMDGSHEVKRTVAENATRDRQVKLNVYFIQKQKIALCEEQTKNVNV